MAEICVKAVLSVADLARRDVNLDLIKVLFEHCPHGKHDCPKSHFWCCLRWWLSIRNRPARFMRPLKSGMTCLFTMVSSPSHPASG